MVRLTFIHSDGTSRDVLVQPGQSLMAAAQAHSIPGIVAECGGSMACATCHVFLDAETVGRLPAAGATESDMLDFAATPRTDYSRLSCQVTISAELDGAQVTIPETQV